MEFTRAARFRRYETDFRGRASLLCDVQRSETTHYNTLGLDRDCTEAQIRAAYRILAKQQHPDRNQQSSDAVKRTQALNAAYEILGDPERRLAYDAELHVPATPAISRRSATLDRNVTQDVHLRIEEFLNGTTLEVKVKDPASPAGRETYQLTVPAGTAPGTRIRLPR